MSIVKAFRFPVQVRWEGDRLTSARAHGKDTLHIATPPEFRGGIEGVWSPEDLLVAATASCYALTLVNMAERREIQLDDVRVSGTGHISKRDDGHFGFVAIELDAEVFTQARSLKAAKAAAEDAKDKCIVGLSLDVPVHVAVIMRTVQEATHFLGSGVAS